MVSDVIIVRVDKKLKEEAKRLGINIKSVVIEALRKSIKEKKKQKAEEILKNLREELKDISEEEWLLTIREMRDTG